MREKNVLLLSEGFGLGHTQAAHALAYGLQLLNADVQTNVIELGLTLRPTLTPLLLSAYRKTMTHSPALFGMVYRYHYRKSLNRLAQLALHRLLYSQTAAYINRLKPDAIVCTHPFPNAVMSRLKRLGLDIPLYTVITDYDAHGTWVTDQVSLYFVSTEEVKRKLLTHAVPERRIRVTGIPVHPNFWTVGNRDELYARFRLRPMPTVMIMGGGWGMLNKQDVLAHLVKWRDSIQFIVCLGNNTAYMQLLAEDPDFRHPNIHLFGFTGDIDKLMDVSDLLITKPGGMTCTEALAKGIPMLFYTPLPGQEQENCHYFTSHGYGQVIDAPADIDRAFAELIRRRGECSAAPARARRGKQPDYHPSVCSRVLMELLSV